MNSGSIQKLGNITGQKKSLANELRSLIGRVKQFDMESKELQNSCITVQNKLDDKVEDMGGMKQVENIKKRLT